MEFGGALAGGFGAGFQSGFGSPVLSAISFGETKEMALPAARKQHPNTSAQRTPQNTDH
ncbi:hypothetical protein [Craterilacuibacter sp. RT1T]|uniref:hypothetical protein n=1 Tax=Craterilacuibacter sp. RT1T TaxID=2942211 RepID=UPI0020BEB129|nr:hypothetical protein [Craterilacuibacter sp. RT1T]MCL6263556.1 hypothetical protein [Craterilacuibacter sp. RT1T]